MIHLNLERNFYYLVVLCLIAGTDVKDIAFSKIITRNKYVSNSDAYFHPMLTVF